MEHNIPPPRTLDEDFTNRMRNSQPEFVGTYLLSSFAPHFRDGMAPGATVAERMIYTTEIPAWPEISPGGTAYAVLLDNTAHPHDARYPWDSVQYCREVGPRRGENLDVKATSAFLGGIDVEIRKYKCKGVKHCPHVDRRLLDPTNFSSHEEFSDELGRVRRSLTQNHELQARREAVRYESIYQSDRYIANYALAGPGPSGWITPRAKLAGRPIEDIWKTAHQ
ncbi:hypothetical protein E4U46_008445 [Claviceps purpurea]|nr:hypothetical protein E4U46_008445 [Claviceps purpurea]